MDYPTMDQVDEADAELILRWYRQLPVAQTATQRCVIEKIKMRFEDVSRRPDYASTGLR